MKRLKKNIGSHCVAYGMATGYKPKYKTYHFTEEWEGDLPKTPKDACIYILDKYYDMFQYFLNYLRAAGKVFCVIPIEVYKQKFREQVVHASSKGYQFEACSNLQDDDSWLISIPRYIKSKKELFILGHEIAHIVLDNLPENESNEYQVIDYKAEYEADKWAYGVLHHFGYLSRDQTLKLLELSQLETLVKTEQLTREDYDKIVRLPQFKDYDRSKGLFSDVISSMIMQGITSGDIPKMLQGGDLRFLSIQVKQ